MALLATVPEGEVVLVTDSAGLPLATHYRTTDDWLSRRNEPR
jgi:hypothetical protein